MEYSKVIFRLILFDRITSILSIETTKMYTINRNCTMTWVFCGVSKKKKREPSAM